ncbi:hypothetical protein SEENIN0B_01147 [Salmonella enterica subsp. enterica serovar Infantis str. SARB27]|uniref:Uncharacterized protein n=1 Tax=Salmonella enterica subsp. enterica serovar Infantis str. SARB27 TaxID=596155 RepID=A0A6C8G6N1_SALIN|nr:hypothetical protein SEENIN0B_01147 [Salmonella enterica subsp. enterica serovar Infantis str. SARB27]
MNWLMPIKLSLINYCDLFFQMLSLVTMVIMKNGELLLGLKEMLR